MSLEFPPDPILKWSISRPRGRADRGRTGEGNDMGNVRNRALRWLAGVMALAALVMVVGLATGAPYARAAEQALTDAATSLAAATTSDAPVDSTEAASTLGDGNAADAAPSATVDIKGSVSVVNINDEDRIRIFGNSEGRFLGFTLKAVDGGPMPVGSNAGTLNVTNGKGDAVGVVDFGTIDYSTVSFDGAAVDPETGIRSKTFTYEVTQHQGLVYGVGEYGGFQPASSFSSRVDFDKSIKTFTVMVSEGQGQSVDVKLSGQGDGDTFAFSDVYHSEPVYQYFEVDSDPGFVAYFGDDFWLQLSNGKPRSTSQGPYVDAVTSPFKGKVSFQVTAIGDAPVPEGTSGNSWIVKNDGNPDDYFGVHNWHDTYTEIKIPLEGITEEGFVGAVYDGESYSKEYTYEVRQVEVPEGVEIDPTAVAVTFKVADYGDGIWYGKPSSAEVIKDAPTKASSDIPSTVSEDYGVGAEDDAVVPFGGAPDMPLLHNFNNYYSASASPSLEASKVVLDKLGADVTSQFGGRLSFILKGEDGAPMPEGYDKETNSITLTNGTGDQAGVIRLGALNYSLADFTIEDLKEGKGSKTYTYTLAEVNSGIDGMSVDPVYREFKVSVVASGISVDRDSYGVDYFMLDSTEGAKLDVKVTDENGNPLDPSRPLFSFTNHYTGPTPTSDTLRFAKTLDGEAPAEGQFSFELEAKDGAPLPAGAADGRATAANAADGSVTFGPIEYAAAGTYDYVVREVDDGQGGVSYDGTVFDVTVTVTANDNGALSATHVVTDAEGNVVTGTPTFNNAYVPESPDTPESPGTPESPDTPESPATTPATSPETGGPAKRLPQTGDATPSAWAFLGLAGVAAALVALGLRTRDHRG